MNTNDSISQAPSGVAALSGTVADDRAPTGELALFVGRRYEVEELDHPDRISDEDLPYLPLVRSYEIPALIGKRFTLRTGGDGAALNAAIASLMEASLCSFNWDPQSSIEQVHKYMMVHTSMRAPVDCTTGQPMALELFAEVVALNGVAIDLEKLSFDARRSLQDSMQELVFEVKAASYANIAYPGVGVAFMY